MNKKIKSFYKNKRILVTGGAGFLGSYVVEKLKQCDPKKIIVPRSKEYDLRERTNCLKVTKDVDIIFHLAANVGGIGKNQASPGELFYDNAIMGIQLIEAARQNSVPKFICLGTICAYPKYTPIPFREHDLWSGYPEETNAPYGLAKKMLLVQSQAYRQQYGMNIIYLLPVNLYGPKDNFDIETSHVVPAIIRKAVTAKKNKSSFIEIWGDGTPTREFLYVEDAAEGILLAGVHYNDPDPVNLGSGTEISIKELATTISQVVGFKGQIQYATDKLNGQPRRMLDTTQAEQKFHFKASTSFEKGLKKTIDWYLKNG